MIRGVTFILYLVTAARAVTLSRRATNGCETQADVTFLLDSSDTVGPDNFKKQLDFVKHTVQGMDIGPNKTRISVVTYSAGVYNQFYLNNYANKQDTINAISNIPFRGGRAFTAEGIKYVYQTSFNPMHGARNGVPHLAVVVTNGPSVSSDLTKLEAQTAKDNNVIMYGVGVGTGVDNDELKSVTSDPDSRYLLHAQGYGALDGVSSVLASRLCNELPTTSTVSLPPPSSCQQKADIAFLIDSSSSVGPGNFLKIENFLKNSISKMDIGADKVHVGVMQYSSYPKMEFPLTQYTDRADAMRAVENIHFMSGGTNTADAISYMKNTMFSTSTGARSNVPRIAIVVTDGGSINTAAATAEADNARQKNIGLVAVGVGSGINMNEINSIADPGDHVVTVSSYDQLEGAVDQILSKTCSLHPTLQSFTTAHPGDTLPPDTCQDKVANCAAYGQSVCTNYAAWANDNCPKFCGKCQPSRPVENTCEDKLSNCGSYDPTVCTQFNEWAKDNCAKFCGFCSVTATSGFYGSCSYKGQTYQAGEKWSDGCDYDCVCENGKTGKYQCFNKCPLYHDLPSECTLIQVPNECCLKPVCNFHQTIAKTEGSGLGQTPNGIKVCEYKGKQYYDGQTWQDGCDKVCTCVDGNKGLYKCDAFCPQYLNLPSYCHLHKAPGDCCSKPLCEFQQQQGSFVGSGSISGQGVGKTPTTQKPCADRINTCSQYGPDVCTSYKGWSNDNCPKYCGFCGVPQAVNQNEFCVFEGKNYTQEQTWHTACSTTCVCEQANYGYYRCTDTCPIYNNLPLGCHKVQKAGECCPIIECSTGSFLGSSTHPNTIGNGATITIKNPHNYQTAAPTSSTGTTLAPGSGGTGFVAPTLRGCLYDGHLYVQNQRWTVGCQYSCQCINETTGTYSCRDKCPVYQNTPSSCHLETDTNDPCCQKPVCRYDPITGTTFVPVPSFKPAVTYQGEVRPPDQTTDKNNSVVYTFRPFAFTPAPPTELSHVTGGIGYCVYKNHRYTHGQTWEDGCEFNCVCENAAIGLYRCVEKCYHYGAIPDGCYLEPDAANPCCKMLRCTVTVIDVTKTGLLTTPAPPKNHCEYKGIEYQTGQTWFDGCDFKCTCDDGRMGIYRCMQRCATYDSVNPNCTFVEDPTDPSCCQIPDCPSPGGNPTPAPVGYYSGFEGGNIGKCIYHGKSYAQGETWSDGCDYDCECVDSAKGYYSCVDKCDKYAQLPANCKLVADFARPCCQKPKCDFGGVTQTITNQPLPPGTTFAPNPIPTLAPQAQFCVYSGVSYAQGQTWNDGCSYRCQCDDASRGIYTCNQRCPKYDQVPAGCTMTTDPSDPCCLAPRCYIPQQTGNATGYFTPDMIPTAAPGHISGSVNFPTLAPVPGGPTQAPPILGWCIFKGSKYVQDAKWFDGCDYECTCTNAASGKYNCVQRCKKYVNLPSQCRLVKDPANPCCQVPECDIQGTTGAYTNQPTPNPFFTLTPPSQTSTPIPVPVPKDVCVYKNKQYNTGQRWYDGCDYVCYCEDGSAGYYRCSERCSSYKNLPSTCSMVADPQDPLCCEVPKCTFTPSSQNYSGFGYPTAAPGVHTGGGVYNPTPRPNPQPTAVPTPAPGSTYPPNMIPTAAPGTLTTQVPPFKDVCVYKGQKYTQGQRWEDGCDFVCQCMDATNGEYQCTEKCPRYVGLPKECQLVSDPMNPCCKKPYCVFTPTMRPPTTLAPGVTPTPAPSCVYSGVNFKQNESWSDGCDLKCVCENATTGYYRCIDRCSRYSALPSTCHLEADPRDSCCKVPVCDAAIVTPPRVYTGSPQPTIPYVNGYVPTLQPGLTFPPGQVPTPAPGYTYAPEKIPTPAPGFTYAPGLLPTFAPGKIPTPAPGLTYAPDKMPFPTFAPGFTPTPAPGSTYAPGLVPYIVPTLQPGLTLPPPHFPTPAPGYTYAPNKIPTPAPGFTYPPGLLPTFAPGKIPTPGPGLTYAPDKMPFPTFAPGKYPTPAPGSTYAPGLIPYIQPTLQPWLTVPPGKVPTPAPGFTYAPNKIPTPYPGFTYAPGLLPTFAPGKIPTPGPGLTYAPDKMPFPTFAPGFVPTPAPGYTYPPGMVPTLSPPLKPFVPGTLQPWLSPPTGSIPTPAPGYTYAPEKIPTPAPGYTFMPGLFPTFAPGKIPTPEPGKTYAPDKMPFPTFAPGFTPTPAPGYTYAPGLVPFMVPTLQPGLTFPTGSIPTPAPGWTYAPDKIPTPGPGLTYAPGLFPTFAPGKIPTPGPHMTYPPNQIPFPTYGPGIIPTPAPGSTYAPGLVPNLYPTLPPGVTYPQGSIPTPAPGYTYASDKIPTPYPGMTYAPGLLPTFAPGKIPTPAPGQTYAPDKMPFPTFAPGMYPTPAPGSTYPPQLVPTNPPPTPFVVPTLPPGMTYPPGQVPTPAPGYTYAPEKIPTPAPGYTYAPGLFPTFAPGKIPTPGPNQTYAPDKMPFPTYAPGIVPTPTPGMTYPPGMIPNLYPTLQPWLTYPPGKVPTPAPGFTYAPEMIPTPYPGGTYAPGLFPTFAPGKVPTPAPGQTYAPNQVPFPTYAPGFVPTPAPGSTYPPGLVPQTQSVPPKVPFIAPTLQPWLTFPPGKVPTPAPGFTYAPEKIPTPYPGGTYAPGLFPTFAPGKVPTPAPGQTYAPNQVPFPTFAPGFIPTPAPGYTYAPGLVPYIVPTLQPGLTFPPGQVPTPAPGYTYAPEKIPTPAPGFTYAPGLLPTFAPGKIPTPAPGLTYAPDKMPFPTFAPGFTPTPAPGSTYAPGLVPYLQPQLPPGITVPPGTIPTPAPGFTYAPNKIPTPYPGFTYAPGLLPTFAPGKIPTPGPGLTFAPDKMPFPTFAPGKYPTPAPGATYPPGMIPYIQPTLAPGQTLPTGQVPTPAPGFTYAPYLIPTPYPGFTYAPGLLPTFAPGKIPTPAPGLTYAPDKMPFPTFAPGMYPTPAPGSTYPPGLFPTPYTTISPFQIPTASVAPSPYPVPTAVPGIVEGKGVNGQGKVCYYKGVIYHQGDTWQDGCNYNCECIEEMTGRYRCTERCPYYLDIPSNCRLVNDPADPCCKKPECTPPPTPAPSSSPTPAPVSGGPTPMYSPTPGPIPSVPTPEGVCVYAGKMYSQGQTWYDGCDKKCICDNGMLGYYRCDDRCKTYPAIPGNCTLTSDPNDPLCCKVPQCIPIPGVNGPTPSPTDVPVLVTGVPGVIVGGGNHPTARPTFAPGPIPTLPPGQTLPPGVTLVPPTVPTPAPMPKNKCVYKGTAYSQGQQWQDGCDYNCECKNGTTGQYECIERCPTFPLVPPQCTMVRNPQDFCCFIPKCDWNAPVPTPGPLGTPAPNSTATAVPDYAFCLYNGVPFKQGQVWDDGCSQRCRCDNAMTNYYSCFDRCPSFNNLDASCSLKTDPKDSCCQIPDCPDMTTLAPTPGYGPTPRPYPVPTLAPGTIAGHGPNLNPDGGIPQPLGFCEYKGKRYHSGETWDDGCNYICKCIEENTGSYTCTERCKRFAALPNNCYMVNDPADSCCKMPYCPSPNPSVTSSPTPFPPSSGTTLSPPSFTTPNPTPKEVCVYNGKLYAQGQKWYDGCSKKCECMDAKIGYYVCSDRCPSYASTSGCIMAPDPNDPECCVAPECPQKNSTNPQGVIGSITGYGQVPTPAPGQTPSPGPKTCYYKGVKYPQGAKWQDGCSYTCECTNATSGKYFCTDRCPKFPNLAFNCQLEYNPQDPCCKMATCTPTPAPEQFEVCVYNGVPYKQGMTWNSGCDKVCRCDDAKKAIINCDDRCPTYPLVTDGCTMVSDPSDSCCLLPKCVNNNSTNPNTVVIAVPGTITNGGRNPTGITGTRTGCVYKGRQYSQGSTWDDGCHYTCTCIDDSTGRYQCTEKCPRYAQLPPTCTMVQDPNNPCCERAYCTPPVTPTPLSTVTPPTNTLSPIKPPPIQDACVYNGQRYQQGQKWYDGCDSVCQCENAASGFYRCQERCPSYGALQPGCTLTSDPRDPACCKIPDCPLIPPSNPPTPGIYTAVPTMPGSVTGYGQAPTPAPTPTIPGQTTLSPPVSPTPQPGCVYKGQLYAKNVQWTDGCQARCTCVDDMTGKYSCTDRCQVFANIPQDRCVMVQDPNDNCCEVPFCDFKNPTPFPNGVPTPYPPTKSTAVPTPMPGQTPTNAPPLPGGPNVNPPNTYNIPNLYPTGAPSTPSPDGKTPGLVPQQKGFCVYKGVYFPQGATWNDGCDKQCRCEDPSKGIYQCTQRCRNYNNLGTSCTLKADPMDSCCLVPDCNTYPTPGPSPSPGGPTYTAIPIISPTAITGTFVGTGTRPNGFTGGSLQNCIYKGKVYNQGMSWDDGCNFHCICEDASRGLYKCSDRCPQYYYLPPQCHYEKDPNDQCCNVAKCDMNQVPTPQTTKNPFSFNPVTGPFSTATPAYTGPTIKPNDVCLYKDNTTHPKGQTWQDGCDLTCTCNDPVNNAYTCVGRCQVFADVPSMCSLIPDPSDNCCEVLSCRGFKPSTANSTTNPPTGINVLPVGTHTEFTGSGWAPGQPIIGTRNSCIYKGHTYAPGSSWNDGCDYVCRCEDGSTGMYRCFSKCPAYPSLPSYCHSVTIPGQCCPSITCDIPTLNTTYNPEPQLVPFPAPTVAPGATPTTPSSIHVVPIINQPVIGGSNLPGGGYPIRPDQTGGIRRQCVYMNKLYNQGESWDDGCSYTCKCLDGNTGYYECKPKCAKFDNLPADCFLVQTPGECCEQPQCNYGGFFINPLQAPTLGISVVGQYGTGFSGFRPGTNFTGPVGTSTGGSNVCMYKGKVHYQGQTWDDGCDYSCVCEDAITGRYMCKSKCPTFTALPVNCYLEDVAGKCCKHVRCVDFAKTTQPPTTLTPPSTTNALCHDNIDNCASYGHSVCSNTYRSWALRNCQAYCNLCGNTHHTAAPGSCVDKLNNCFEYGADSCVGIYKDWAKENCCNYCSSLTTSATTTTTAAPVTSAPCEDKVQCDAYKAFCTTAAYISWIKTNCPKTCGYCGTTPAPVTTVAPGTGIPYILLMKGVAGVPGDLFTIWSGTSTVNPNVPEAQFLTANYPGHYKPDLSNNWNALCLDKVKVSIYNQGVEKAYIVFNATGADKMSWFTPDRIIDSTWTDIKTATKQYFQMKGDPAFGRQFYSSQQENGCSSVGWMFISTSTSNPCSFEIGSKPAFFYAPGQSAVQWGFTQPGTGDVFAIQGHSTCPNQVQTPTQPPSAVGKCIYKGKYYSTGEKWIDNCEKNCTCTDGNNGIYKCYALCPVYSSLPPNINLVDTPGQCCKTLVIAAIEATTLVFTAPPRTCYYKGNWYKQDEEWTDGCLYRCTCTNAVTGAYTCTSRCPSWNFGALSNVCHLDPAPQGKCCQLPNCPSWVHLNYPPHWND